MNEYKKIAKDLANENLMTNAGGPFGACIVKEGKIIGKGSNHVLKNNDPTAHAEVMAIRDACKNIAFLSPSRAELHQLIIGIFPYWSVKRAAGLCFASVIKRKLFYNGTIVVHTNRDAVFCKLGYGDGAGKAHLGSKLHTERV